MECEEKETKNNLNMLGVKLQVKVKIINDMKAKNKEKEQDAKKKVNGLEKDIEAKDQRIKDLNDKLVNVEQFNSQLIEDMKKEHDKCNNDQ